MRRVLLLTLLALGGCVHQASPPATTPLPTPVSCVPVQLAPEPAGLATPEELAAIPDGPARYKRLGEDWLRRVARMLQTEPVLASCRDERRAPAPPG